MLAFGIRGVQRTQFWGIYLRLGATWYVLYNAVLLAFATPYNRLFLGYVATLGLAISASAMQMHLLDRDDQQLRPPQRVRRVSIYILVVAGLNCLVWLSRVGPGTIRGDYGLLHGTGLTTNPVIVQDLAFWLPLAVIVALLFRSGTAIGGQLAGSLLVFWLLESVGVAIDQWLGHRADPSSPVATLGASYLFTTLAVVGLAVLAVYLRAFTVSSRAQDERKTP